MLNIEVESFECEKCPYELVKDDAENDYESVMDVHIADGIDMGNIINMVRGIPEDELFGNCAPENSVEKKGIEAPQRTFLNNKKQREVISKLLEDRNDQKSMKAALMLKKLNTKGKPAIPCDDHLEISHELLEHIDEIVTRVPIG